MTDTIRDLDGSTDVTAILVARDEGAQTGVALHSMLDAVRAARAAGLAVEVVAVLATPTTATREALAEASSYDVRVVEVASADPGAVRNQAVAATRGKFVALLDAGALWSENWLVAAHAIAAAEPTAVVHPEIHWFYEHGRELYFPPDQDDPAFDASVLAIGNCWDAQAFVAREVCAAVPFPEVGESAGPGALDAAWARALVAAGHRHRVAPTTINFRKHRPLTLR